VLDSTGRTDPDPVRTTCVVYTAHTLRPAGCDEISLENTMSRYVLFLAIGFMTLSACATTPEPGNPPMTTSCNADAARVVIGKTASADVVEQARVAAGARTARVLEPGQMVTMEFMEGRLNIDVDSNNVITNVRCG